MDGIWQILYYTLRVLHMIINNVVAIPAYVVWFILLTPVRKFRPDIYWKVECVLFKALLSMVVMWAHSGGYKMVESGDDLRSIHDKRTLLLVNHQSTADIPCVMSALLPKSRVIGQIFWIMDYVFIITNFGWISYLHGDFFIQQGKKGRETELIRLREHLLSSYLKTDKRWIVLFPEGGFLYKRKERSQKYAEKNNLPVLNHVTLPRAGAMNIIINTVGNVQSNGSHGDQNEEKPKLSKNVEWVVDMTLAYPKGEAIDMIGICIGWWKPRDMHVHYRAYPMTDIPVSADGQRDWLYDRYVEKEALLEHYYKHDVFPDSQKEQHRLLPVKHQSPVPFDNAQFIIAYVFYAISAYIFWLYVYGPMWNTILAVVGFILRTVLHIF